MHLTLASKISELSLIRIKKKISNQNFKIIKDQISMDKIRDISLKSSNRMLVIETTTNREFRSVYMIIKILKCKGSLIHHRQLNLNISS